MPCLETLAGVTREEFGCVGYYFEDEAAAGGIENPVTDNLIREMEANEAAQAGG